MSDTKKYLVGMFDDDDVLLHAVKDVRKAGYEITDAFTPFPVHQKRNQLYEYGLVLSPWHVPNHAPETV